MKTAVLTTVALIVVLAQASLAQARGGKPSKRAAPAASDTDADEAAKVEGRGNHTTAYDFDDDDVRGLVVRPEGMPVGAQARARFPSLLSIRGHFLPELIRMAKDV